MWQPIETAPKDGRPVLLFHPLWMVTRLLGGWDAHEHSFRIYGWGCPATQPTHWHEVPESPQ